MNLAEAKIYNPKPFIFKYNSRDTIIYSLGSFLFLKYFF